MIDTKISKADVVILCITALSSSCFCTFWLQIAGSHSREGGLAAGIWFGLMSGIAATPTVKRFIK